jgi:catechol 2,3-dioxygenase-like lactoylglutathione lyase family enzyme
VGRAGIHHVDLVVSSLERSLPFYRELLEPLGYTRAGTITGERGETVWYLGGTGAGSIGLRESRSAGPPVDRYALGLHHLAVSADSRARVDECARRLHARGAELESEPREYDYIPGYYAVFFSDPDGLKLEVVHVPDEQETA